MHPRRTRLITAGLFLAISGVALAACSGSSGDSGDRRLSKEKFVDKANDICAASKSQIAQLGAPSLADPAAVEASIAQAVAIHRQAYRQLRALDPPKRDQPGVKAWLESVRGAIDQMDAVRQALADGDSDAITAATREGAGFTTDAEAFADAYGLNECSTTEEESQ